MKTRQFGKTDLLVSEVGFGAWAIGGPAMAGTTPIGWGPVNDQVSIKALEKAADLGINFYDSADIYGFGHSEDLLGQAFGNRDDLLIATKVGQKTGSDGKIIWDHTKSYIQAACEASLRRLKRETIDFYQFHVAKVAQLEQGECVEAMEQLQQQGKIRYWGISLNTFNPEPEAEFMFHHQLGAGFQLVFNIFNQRALHIIEKAHQENYGIIARMPLQFGLLTGKFTRDSKFAPDDHRQIRLTPEILQLAIQFLEEDIWPLKDKYHIPATTFSLSYILSFPEISTIIPGIRTPEQAMQNTHKLFQLDAEDIELLIHLYHQKFYKLVEMMETTNK